MKIRTAFFFSVFLSVSIGVGWMVAQNTKLSAQAQSVVDYLLTDWRKPMHSTSIPLAMDNLGVSTGDDIRLEVGRYFRQNRRLARNLINWTPNNYLLSNEEKRIAKQIINTYERDERIPGLEELSRQLAVPAARLKDRMNFMERAGLLKRSSEKQLGFDLVEKYFTWGGPLRYNFHTIAVGDGKPFDVW